MSNGIEIDHVRCVILKDGNPLVTFQTLEALNSFACDSGGVGTLIVKANPDGSLGFKRGDVSNDPLPESLSLAEQGLSAAQNEERIYLKTQFYCIHCASRSVYVHECKEPSHHTDSGMRFHFCKQCHSRWESYSIS